MDKQTISQSFLIELYFGYNFSIDIFMKNSKSSGIIQFATNPNPDNPELKIEN